MSAGPNLCKSCGAPIPAGAHRWAGREPEEYWHYSCAEKASLTGRRRPVPPPDQPCAGEARADILLVDDSPEIRDSYGAVLRSAGYRVHAASCHREVLDLLDRAQPVDLLCTDIVMPEGLGGVGLARLVRARRPALHILYITGYDIPSISGQRELHVMRKPVPPETLLEAVEQAVTAPPAQLSRTHSLGR